MTDLGTCRCGRPQILIRETGGGIECCIECGREIRSLHPKAAHPEYHQHPPGWSEDCESCKIASKAAFGIILVVLTMIVVIAQFALLVYTACKS